jgi:pimeloyl-ACP methyl ester carboxylesterase
MTELALPRISTIVRMEQPGARLAFRLAQRLGTPVAAALLERFFLTPRRTRMTPEEAAFLTNGRAESLESSVGRLATWQWGEGETVLLVHGWGSRAARYRTIAPALVAAGYRVVAFDGPGHGASAGRRSSLPETARAIEAVARREYNRRGAWPRALVAHSFGCAAAILAQANGVPFKHNVLLAPASDFDAHMARVATALSISSDVTRAMIWRVERRLNFSWAGVRIERAVERIHSRIQIFHDPADAEVPFSDALLLHKHASDSQLIALNNLGHKRLLHDQFVIQRIIRFLGQS